MKLFHKTERWEQTWTAKSNHISEIYLLIEETLSDVPANVRLYIYEYCVRRKLHMEYYDVVQKKTGAYMGSFTTCGLNVFKYEGPEFIITKRKIQPLPVDAPYVIWLYRVLMGKPVPHARFKNFDDDSSIRKGFNGQRKEA